MIIAHKRIYESNGYIYITILFQITGQWNGLIRLLQDKKADMVVGSLQITPKRSEQVEFSVPYLGTGLAIVVSFRKGAISATAVLGMF